MTTTKYKGYMIKNVGISQCIYYIYRINADITANGGIK